MDIPDVNCTFLRVCNNRERRIGKTVASIWQQSESAEVTCTAAVALKSSVDFVKAFGNVMHHADIAILLCFCCNSAVAALLLMHMLITGIMQHSYSTANVSCPGVCL